MSHKAFVLWVYLPLYALLTFMVFRQWRKHPDRPRRDAVLLFLVMFVSQVIATALPETPLLAAARRMLAATGYYLVITLLGHVEPVPRSVQRGALAVASVVAASTLVGPFVGRSNLFILDAAIDLFGGLVILYTGAAVRNGAGQTGGVVRRRLVLIAAATYLVGILTLVKILLPVSPYLITIAMVPFFPLAYLGFATPAWYIQIWQREGLYAFLRDCAQLPTASRSTAMLDQLLPAAARTVGAVAITAAMFPESSDKLVLHPAHPGMTQVLDPASFPCGSEPRYLTDRSQFGPELQAMATGVGAGAIMIVPITTPETTFGFLVAFLRHRALFPEDDLTLLSLMTEQVAVALGVAALHLQLVQQNQSLEERVQDRTRALREAKVEILRHLARATEFRDDDTGDHQERVGDLSALLAKQLGLPDDEVERIRLAAPLHDVGKIGIPDSILLKPGRLSEAEFALMQSHTTIGAAIFAGCQYSVLVAAQEIALSHHEKWDGTGYPAGLAGDAIPLRGRIVAVADVFDALTHTRTYKTAWSTAAAVQEVQRLSGTHLDPSVVSAFLALIQSGAVPEGRFAAVV